MERETIGGWEQLPEVVTNRQYVRCLDRLVQSLPVSARLRLFMPLISAAVDTASGAACFRATVIDGAPPTPAERESHRQRSLGGIRASRDGLERIRGIRSADRAELLVAAELLDRIEEMLRNGS